MNNLDSSLFPGLSSHIEVHNGFQTDQSKYIPNVVSFTRDLICHPHYDRTASDILSSVQTAMSKYGTSSVTMVGHSLGEHC